MDFRAGRAPDGSRDASTFGECWVYGWALCCEHLVPPSLYLGDIIELLSEGLVRLRHRNRQSAAP